MNKYRVVATFWPPQWPQYSVPCWGIVNEANEEIASNYSSEEEAQQAADRLATVIKAALTDLPAEGESQEAYIRRMIREYESIYM